MEYTVYKPWIGAFVSVSRITTVSGKVTRLIAKVTTLIVSGCSISLVKWIHTRLGIRYTDVLSMEFAMGDKWFEMLNKLDNGKNQGEKKGAKTCGLWILSVQRKRPINLWPKCKTMYLCLRRNRQPVKLYFFFGELINIFSLKLPWFSFSLSKIFCIHFKT